ncbi:MAG: hypothetical protein WC717_00400 [Candidatus Micrarchaeia archaeon]|jgi:hypothetical protein
MPDPMFKQRQAELPQQPRAIKLDASSRQILASAVEQALTCIHK